MPDPSQTLPDVLETLGMSITEIGAVQVGTDRVLRSPSGDSRLTLVFQSAWSGALEVQVVVKVPAESALTRKVALAHGEVRRARLPLRLPEGVSAVTVSVAASVPAGAKRVRTPWLRHRDAGDSSMWGIFVGALRQAVGRGGQDAPAAASEADIAIPVEVQAGELAIAAEEEAVWQVGMDAPPPSEVSARPAAELVPKPQVEPPPAVEPGPVDERLACPRCGAKSFAELIKSRQVCPVCDQPWNL